jgi:hypothetical protein
LLVNRAYSPRTLRNSRAICNAARNSPSFRIVIARAGIVIAQGLVVAARVDAKQDALEPGPDLHPLPLVAVEALAHLGVGPLHGRQTGGERFPLPPHLLVTGDHVLKSLLEDL